MKTPVKKWCYMIKKRYEKCATMLKHRWRIYNYFLFFTDPHVVVSEFLCFLTLRETGAAGADAVPEISVLMYTVFSVPPCP